MMSLTALWLPILLSAVAVFVVSSLIHMLLKYHQNDFSKLPRETEVLEAMRPFSIPPGDYFVPFCSGPEEAKSDEVKEKQNKGPVFIATVLENGPPKMGASLVGWFIYSVIVSIFAGYVASRALGMNAHYLDVFRFVGTTAFAGYSLALLQNSIWYKRNWGATLKSMFDGLIYALVSAGVFGWLWPRM